MNNLLFMAGHKLFGTKHIIIIVISIALIVGLYFLSRKLSIKTLSKVLLGVGIVSEFTKIFSYIVMNENKVYTTFYKLVEGENGEQVFEAVESYFAGVLPKTDLPFQLCSIQIIFILIVNIAKSEKLKRFILSFMMPSCLFGGLAAILIATDSSRNVWVITLQYFLYHIAIVVFALRLLTAKEMKWRARDLLNAYIMIVGIMFFSIYINSILFDGISNINFMYVVKPPQSGLPYLNDNNGWLSYIIKYMVLVVGCIGITYIGAIINTIKDKTIAKREAQETQRELIEK